MLAVLEIQTGQLEGVKAELTPGQTCVVGRGAQSSLIVPDDRYLSGQHCSIQCKEDGCVLRDLNSTNGTWLNDQRVQECKLLDGDVFVAGTTRLAVELRPHRGSAATPRPHFTAAKTTEVDPQVAQQLASATITGSIRARYSNEDLQRLAEQEQTECIPLDDPAKADQDEAAT